MTQLSRMAAKKKIAPPKPQPGRPWSELTKAEQNAEYVRALRSYTDEGGSNPGTRGSYVRARQEGQTG
jgi:hypothetical protein